MKDIIQAYNKYNNLNKDDTLDFDKFNHYTLVYHSNSIEGSTLTLEETISLLDKNLTPKSKPLEHALMAVDHFKALNYIIDLARKKTKLTEEIIKNISAIILKSSGGFINTMAGNFDSSKGDYRLNTVRAGTTTFIDYKKVPERVKELINVLNSNIDKVIGFTDVNNLAFDVHYQMVSIHPFADGNGRLSRLLMNYVQEYHKMPLTVVLKEDKQAYFQALINTREKEDISVFRNFMFQQAQKYFNIKIREMTTKQKQVKNRDNREDGFSFLF